MVEISIPILRGARKNSNEVNMTPADAAHAKDFKNGFIGRKKRSVFKSHSIWIPALSSDKIRFLDYQISFQLFHSAIIFLLINTLMV